ncbi:MAG: FemAB family PEP-CTERM system-associated protein [Deltaproteobacteria bacterium]|nr:FemAB family PEP-CTERM system-associated protein [Deltaproteobacteria bacterium]
MEIKLIQDSDIDSWEKYILDHPGGTFYHALGWKRVIEKSFGHHTYYLMAKEHGKVCGILPIVHIKSLLFGSIMCSMPFLNFGGVCADNDEVERALLGEAERILKDKKGDYLELRHMKKSSMDYPAKTHKVSMTLELESDPEILWSKFATKHRTTIRRAAKNDLELRVGKQDLLKDFFPLLCKGWKALGTPLYNFYFFKNIMEELEDHIEIFLILHQSRPIAGAMNGIFRDTVEGMWLASLNEYARLQGGYFLYWEMIRRYCELGYRHFHLGRSTADGSAEFFKKKWNAVPKPLFWEYIMNRDGKLPELNVQNSKYQLAINVWKKLPLPVTKTLGPIFARSIP